MLTAIKRILSSLFNSKQKEPPAPPHDPYAYRSAPRKRGPYERGGAVAVFEPDDGEELIGNEKKVEEYL
ncbi:MAG TPA: hypothetical protein VJ180_09655 [Pyrinomonadaceae bacterium]|nr:hypothetical protein [Pyrinomonadaceae bacterium]HKZ81283.1 hypothetical protein [Pyrinomonadaceae bacterium]